MKVGAITAFADIHSPDYIAEVCGILEEVGFHSMWAPEHALFFPEHDSQYPYTEDGKVMYQPKGVMDPFIALTFAAAHTSRIKLCTGVSIVPQRNPVYLSKFVADLDLVSAGRFEFGAGVGWQKEEYDAVGECFENRGKRMNECIELMKALWSREEISNYQGEFYSVKDAYAFPKPIQTPHPPFILGGESKPALRRVAKMGQGWFGVASSPETFSENLKILDGMLEENGRSRSDISIYLLTLAAAVSKEDVNAYRDRGCEQIVLRVPARTVDNFREKALRAMDLVNG